eukprot:CAMPEP_0172641292 /NCGR_PEP_ID=MMETSP1068-20121228/226634_1 /TAXON_ID=35684 /ORGANISM="Pseudopedinella elastica, Strain CCMP716" /LENGTH=144 /DNA_ID=CAMNT_0013454847 /DNA_START=157 /DNA_END=588 /DNA_ORIENTATION=+
MASLTGAALKFFGLSELKARCDFQARIPTRPSRLTPQLRLIPRACHSGRCNRALVQASFLSGDAPPAPNFEVAPPPRLFMWRAPHLVWHLVSALGGSALGAGGTEPVPRGHLGEADARVVKPLAVGAIVVIAADHLAVARGHTW